ncbi:MAG: LpqB family beta-propeller domain-containing protein [Micromonosporaceae bacterium]
MGERHGPVRLIQVLAVMVCAVAATSCATVPDGGLVRSATIGQKGAQQDVTVQLIPPSPAPGWDPAQIVRGFLLASATFSGDHAIARKYLTPSASRAWHPGSSVSEFSEAPTATAGPPGKTASVDVTGKQLGKISEDGQYQAVEQGVNSHVWTAALARVRGQWRIENPPAQLLLSKTDVDRAFRFRDLYFFDASMSVLVPDPVYVPAEAATADLVAHLVHALSEGPQGWLAGAARTAFPAGTTLLGTSVAGGTATVNLGGLAATAGSQQLWQIGEQLLQTLASAPTFPEPDVPPVQSVVLEVAGRPVHVSCASGTPPELLLNQCQPPLPVTQGSPAYYVDHAGRVATLSGSRSDGPVAGQAGTGSVPLETIAVSLDRKNLAAVSGNALYTASLSPNGVLTRRLTAAGLTMPSWDRDGGLWVAGRSGGQTRVWRLDGGDRPVEVGLPSDVGQVSALRVAPDGVRVAIITGSGAGSRLWLAAILREGTHASIGQLVPIGTDIRDFTDLTWYDTSDLLALARPASGPVIYMVPADGGRSRQMATEAETVSIAASGGSPTVAARNDGDLLQLPVAGGSIWLPAGAGQATVHGTSPVYPG